ncbi:Far upstream element-binding protein, partial [Thalictrum thalictroides]
MAEEVYSSSKRKYEDQTPPPSTTGGHRRPTGFSAPISSISPDASSAPTSYNNVPPPPTTPMDEIQIAKQKAQEIALRLFSNAEAKRPRTENGGSNDDSYDSVQKPSGFSSMSQSLPIPYGFQGSTGFQGSSKKIDIPNGRVGVIIGKGGETIKYLQGQSGAKIQVTRDMDADPNSPNRAVELTGTPEQISKAEHLIKEVLDEAESGGSGTVSKRFNGQPGADQFSMKVPNNKVGLIIGKGGETIKTMQAKSGARIQ